MRRFVPIFFCSTALFVTIVLLQNFYEGLGGWDDIPETKSPYKNFATKRGGVYGLSRKLVKEPDTNFVVELDDFSYTGAIKASAYNPFVPLPRKPPPPKKGL